MIDKLASFIREALSESSQNNRGVASIGRILTVILVVTVLTWDSCYMWFAWRFNNHLLSLHQPLPAGFSILPVLPDVPTLASQVAFMTAFYVANKFAGSYVDAKIGSSNT